MKKILKWLLIVAVCMILGGVIMAHEKANLICEDMCLVEGIPKDDIRVLAGVLEKSSSDDTVASVSIDYPEGFTDDNCIILAYYRKIALYNNYVTDGADFVNVRQMGGIWIDMKFDAGVSLTDASNKVVVVIMKIS